MAPAILLLVGTVLLAIAEVFLLCIAGYILARMGILNSQTRKQVNRLNTSIFTPALLFTKVAFSLTPAQLKELWIIPVLFTIVTATSAASAYLLGMLFRISPSQRNFAMACGMFMNSNSMPIALISSLIGTVDLRWNENDTQANMLTRSLTYLVLYSTLGNIARWSFGVKILEKSDDTVVTPEGAPLENEKDLDIESQPSGLDLSNGGFPLSHSRSQSSDAVTGKAPMTRPHSQGAQPRFYLSDEPSRSAASLPALSASQPAESHIPLSTKSSSATLAPFSLVTAMQAKSEAEASAAPPVPLTRTRRFLNALKRFWWGFYEFMTMPLWAAFLSIIIAVIPPVQNIIANHMPPVRQALESAGDCSIPLTLVVLGAYFYTPPAPGTVAPPLKERLRSMFSFRRSDAPMDETPKRPGEKRTMLIAVLARHVFCPLTVLPLMLVFIKFDVPKVFSDPVFVISNVLLVAAPIALTLAQMSTKTGASDGFERKLSTTIFYSYVVALTPTTIIYVVLGLLFIKF